MRAYARHEDALIAKLKLLEFSESEIGRRYLVGFQDSMNAMHVEEERLPRGLLGALQVETLRKADPIYVSADVTDLVDTARETFVPEVLLPGDPFCPVGFAILPRPILLDDAPVTEANQLRSPTGILPVRAIAWMPMHSEDLEQGCFWISFYTHVEDDVEHGRKYPDGERGRVLQSLAPLSLVHMFQWSWGHDPSEYRAGLVEGEGTERSEFRARQQTQLVQAFWRLGQQFVPAKERAPRALRREAKRRRTEDDLITVMVLRRAKGEEHEGPENGQHYSVQFLVRGYWARRHTREGPKQVWVRPHVKGPEGAPMRLTERRWEFTR